jgi:hypothetical protein
MTQHTLDLTRTWTYIDAATYLHIS